MLENAMEKILQNLGEGWDILKVKEDDEHYYVFTTIIEHPMLGPIYQVVKSSGNINFLPMPDPDSFALINSAVEIT